jgi:DHA1 family bicyclomycin/chloramphenicol resistance-like MFS transporter
MVTIPARVKDEFEGKEAAKVNSFVMLLMTLAPLIAPFIGSWMTRLFPWQSIFVFMLICSLVVFILQHFYLEDYKKINSSIAYKKLQLPLKKYIEIFKNRQALGYIFCHGFFTSGMLAFIAASPYVYIDYYHVPISYYPWLFAVSIAAISVCSYFNTRLVEIFSVHYVIISGAILAFLSALITLLALLMGVSSLPIVIIDSTLYMGCLGIISPNANSLALTLFKESAGTASAVSGAIRFGLSSVSTSLLSIIALKGAIPMLTVMSIAGALSTIFLLRLAIIPCYGAKKALIAQMDNIS